MSECIEWWGTRSSYGYGVLWRGGRMLRAHRVIWEECFGEIPADKPLILHSCDNPPCVNPEHLRPGTPADNMADKVLRGRARGGRWQAGKTECKHGHPLSGPNLYVDPGSGKRVCRECRRAKARRYWRRQVEVRTL